MDEPLRISDPGDLVAALPGLLGFWPHESMVVMALGSGGRIGLTARCDLPPGPLPAARAADLARRMAGEDPVAVVVVVVSEAPDERDLPWAGEAVPDLPHRGLVHDVLAALTAREIAVRDAVLARAGRWWSYDCPHVCCAPGAGTPLPGGTSPVTVAAMAAGAVVEPDRAALRARIAPSVGPAAEACAEEVWQRGIGGTTGRGAERGSPEEVIARALRRCRPGGPGRLPDREVAAVVWALTDRDVRDRAMGLALGDDAAAAETLWTECTRRAPTPLDAAPATLLAVSAWLRGDGAMANVALDRALTSLPGYRLAVLLAEALAACVPPAQLRVLIADVVGRADDGRGAG